MKSSLISASSEATDDIRQAIKDFDKVIELNPKDQLAYYNRGTAYGRLGNSDQEIIDTKRAAQLGFKPAQDYLRSKGINR
jgi:tetratricopeptide (TPR) repeat protein